MFHVYADVVGRKFILKAAKTDAEGQNYIGQIDLGAREPSSPEFFKNSQVLFHHVEELAIKAKLFGYSGYSIVHEEEEEEPVGP